MSSRFFLLETKPNVGPEVFIKIVVKMNMYVLKQSSVTKQRPHFGVNKNSVPYFSVVIDNPIQVCTWSCKRGFLLEKFQTNTGVKS